MSCPDVALGKITKLADAADTIADVSKTVDALEEAAGAAKTAAAVFGPSDELSREQRRNVLPEDHGTAATLTHDRRQAARRLGLSASPSAGRPLWA